jgi:Ni/Fe-hydrogenase subunit HybB-like protein
MSLNKVENELLKPIYRTGLWCYVVLLLCIIGVLLFLYMWYNQLTQGFVVTGMRDYGVPLEGSPWGIYMANFVWFVGVAHGGIVISAAIRIAKLERYKSIARMAELLTVITLLMAALSILIDTGRPDRLFNMVIYYLERVASAPPIWDLTVILVYFSLSLTYLYLLMREDLAYLRVKLPKFRRLYNILLVGYREDEDKKIEQIAWWMALALLVLVALLSGGVIPWIFGLMSSQAGWFGAVQGPYFLTAALASAIAAVIVIAALMRAIFKWNAYINLEIFKGLSVMLSILTVIYLWFILHEHLTMQFAAPSAEKEISNALLFGKFAGFFWAVIGMLMLGFVILSAQAISRRFSLAGTVFAAVIVLFALWVKRYLIIVPSLVNPRLELYTLGSYTPTGVEYTLVIGTFAIATLLYIVFLKVFPIMDVRRLSKEAKQEEV